MRVWYASSAPLGRDHARTTDRRPVPEDNQRYAAQQAINKGIRPCKAPLRVRLLAPDP